MSKEDLSRSQDPGAHSDSDTESDDECEALWAPPSLGPPTHHAPSHLSHLSHPQWLLGFCEPPDGSPVLLRHHFPSKIGGSPAWLDPVDLPARTQLAPTRHAHTPTAAAAAPPLRFLLQVYAPIDTNPHAFHRTIYLFAGPTDDHGESRPNHGDHPIEGGTPSTSGATTATKPEVRAFRCQLPRENAYYPPHPASETDTTPPRLSQDAHAWSAFRDPWGVVRGEGPPIEGHTAPVAYPDPSATLLASWPEFELVVEPEADVIASTGDHDEQVKRVLEAYEAKQNKQNKRNEQPAGDEGQDNNDENAMEGVEMDKNGDQEDQRIDENELVDMVAAMGAEGGGLGGEVDEDRRVFAHFQARVDQAKGQVLRYCYDPGAVPLWPVARPRPPPGSEVPCCPHCGAARRFEFQVLPHLVYYLGQDADAPGAFDFGSIAVYTCSASCTPDTHHSGGGDPHAPSRTYLPEYVYVLDAL